LNDLTDDQTQQVAKDISAQANTTNSTPNNPVPPTETPNNDTAVIETQTTQDLDLAKPAAAPADPVAPTVPVAEPEPDSIVRPNKDESLDALQAPLKSAQNKNVPDFAVELENKPAAQNDPRVESVQPAATEPETRDVADDNKINVAHYDVGPRYAGELKPDEEVEDIQPPATSSIADLPGTNLPLSKPVSADNSAIKYASVAVIILMVAFSAGFFGYKYSGNVLKGASVMADEETSTSESAVDKADATTATTDKTTTTPTVDAQVTANWPIYSNTKYKYSVRYPDTWFGQNTSKADADTVSFTSFKPETTGTGALSGFKVEIVFQASQGKTVDSWIEANNTITGSKPSKTSSITIDGQKAVSQTFDSPLENISTYLVRNDKIMIITYYAPTDKFTEGQANYQKILDNIKFTN